VTQATSARLRGRRSAVAIPRIPWGAAPIAAVTVLAGVLRLVGLAGTQTNPYYDAAIRSMGQSWHNFFFAAFEPGASVSIDKPPVDLWLQVVSVKLFGWHTTTLILPQALAATLAVALLYSVVTRLFGRAAGLASALALAVMPISVMTSRSDTMDSLMMALSVLAAWLVVRAAETDRKRFLFLAAGVMGLNFEVKLFEALLAVPALVLLYLLAAPRPVPRRVGALAVALPIFVAVAVAWPTAVSLAPSHPYAIGSTNGSVWNAIFVFNGSDRINPPSGSSSAAPARAKAPAQRPRPAPPPRPAPRPPAHHHATASDVQGRISGSGEPPGIRRLFTLGGYFYGQNLGIELGAAILLGGLALLWGALAELERLTRARRTGERIPVDPRRRLARAGAIAFAVWLVSGFAVYSHVRGVLHPRYLEAMTPAVAVGLGAGLVACARLASVRVVGLLAFFAAFALSVRYAISVAASDTTLATVVIAAAVATAVAAVAAFALARRPARFPAQVVALGATVALALTSLLAPALARSALIIDSKAQDAGSPGAQSAAWVRHVSAYLRGHTAGARYEFASASYGQAGPLIVHDGRPVMVLTGFSRRPIVKLATLERAARTGQVRYAVLNDQCGRAALSDLAPCPKTVAWIREHSVDVTQQLGINEGSGVVFRLKR
jgi:4-amino-4-deoxy-L-arabinose transferase-like glycosyltransferase